MGGGLADGLMTQRQAAFALGLQRRQVYRPLQRYREDGPAGLASRRRGKPGNRQLASGLGARAVRLKRACQPRNRRECVGELIQIDGSDHRWFEDRAPPCTLLVYVDDATSRIMTARFVQSESMFEYGELTKQYLQQYRRPLAFYSDRLSVFRPTGKDAGHL